MRPDTAFWCHKRRIGHYHVKCLVPPVFTGKRVIFINFGLGKIMQIHINQRQLNHIRRNVITNQIVHQFFPLIRRQFIFIFPANMFVSGNQKAGRAASRIKNGLVLLRINHLNNKINNMARCPKLPSVSLGTHYGKQILKSIAQIFAIAIVERTDFF